MTIPQAFGGWIACSQTSAPLGCVSCLYATPGFVKIKMSPGCSRLAARDPTG